MRLVWLVQYLGYMSTRKKITGYDFASIADRDRRAAVTKQNNKRIGELNVLLRGLDCDETSVALDILEESGLGALRTWADRDAKACTLEDAVAALLTTIDGANKGQKPVEIKKGRKYIKVIADGSAWCFIDADGDIFKASSWSAPAKHARGNVFNGREGDIQSFGCTNHGPRYL